MLFFNIKTNVLISFNNNQKGEVKMVNIKNICDVEAMRKKDWQKLIKKEIYDCRYILLASFVLGLIF